MDLRWRLASFAGVALVAGVASASILLALPLETLTGRADRIVLGKVEKLDAKWTGDHSAIYSDVTIRVERTYKGSAAAGTTMIVRREGGSVDGIGMKVFGAAEFAVGEEAVVFAEQRGEAAYVVGMAQGKLHVARGTNTNTNLPARVVQDLSGMGLMGKPDARLGGLMSLEELELELARIVAMKPVQK